MWTLYFLKHYPRNSILHLPFCHTNEKNFRQQVWEVINFLFENMKELQPLQPGDHVVVDATECPIQRPLEPWIESSTYSGYKKRHTLKYEVAVTEETGTPVHVKGPYPGPTADVTIFQESLKVKMQLLNLPPGLADGTYQGEPLTLIVPPRPFHSLTPFQRQLHYHIS